MNGITVYGALMQALQRNGIDINDEDAIIAVLDTCLIATEESEGVWHLPVPTEFRMEDYPEKARVMIHAELPEWELEVQIWPPEGFQPNEPLAKCKADWDMIAGGMRFT